MSDRRTALSGIWRTFDLRRGYRAFQTGAKVRALLADLEALRRAHRSVCLVVFTNHTHCCDDLRESITAAGFLLCGFKGGTRFRPELPAEHRRGAERARRDICREGQGTHRNDQVGNVGLMLTAATRVYLMEPYRSTRRWRCRQRGASQAGSDERCPRQALLLQQLGRC
uniref:Helicase C-terminal domain-containing protein n=1 Tax=Chrysotila carterae TaxID=13221 RepID=A0A7S4BHF1_CHRCT